MKIAITGGKGGTGKSLVSAFLAKKLSKLGKTILLDLDVENPTQRFIFNYKLRLKKIIYKGYPKINKKKCRKCGVCAKKCRIGAIAWIPGEYPRIIKDLCKGCLLCKYVCPYNAIEIEREIIGWIRVGGKRPLLIEGRSKLGLEETSEVVEETISYSENYSHDYAIFDTASGIHCNVLKSLLKADIIVLVTEPTPFGISDLRRILEAIEELKKPKFIVINKAGIGDVSEIFEISKKFETKVIGEIKYSEKLARAYSKGRILEKYFEIDMGDII